MEEKKFCLYILSNERNTVLYTGVTGDLSRRLDAHRTKVVKGFTAKYNVTKLVYIAVADSADAAIAEEKRIKGGSRAKKIALIESQNPEWKDLSDLL